jgi:regulatory protein YycI of two-component signal transduction system YycFG
MSTIMTREISVEFRQELRRKRERQYQAEGITHREVTKEIAKGIRLPWKQVKAKSYSIDVFREETGRKEDPKIKVEHEVKPIRLIYVTPAEKRKSKVQIKRD